MDEYGNNLPENAVYIPKSGHLYAVTPEGNIISYQRTKKGHILKPIKNNWGYCWVAILQDGVSVHKLVHRLVAEAFVENPEPGKYNIVNHKNEIRDDNRAENLEWCDTQYNIRYSVKRRGGHTVGAGHPRQVALLDKYGLDIERVFWSTRQAARYINPAREGTIYSNISKACKDLGTAEGRIWRYITQKEYIDFITEHPDLMFEDKKTGARRCKQIHKAPTYIERTIVRYYPKTGEYKFEVEKKRVTRGRPSYKLELN